MKVVRMLQDMATELEKERAEDKEIHSQIGCWCETNEKDKKASIDQGTARIADLDSAHGEYTSKISELMEGVSSTRDKIIADKKALDTAVAVRMKETKTFHGQETDLLQAIQALKQAIVVLSKHNPDLAQLRSVTQSLHALQAMQLAKDALSRDKMAVLNAFIEEAQDSSMRALRRIPGFKSYTPRSGQIFGILKQLKEEFEGDLSTAQKSEQQAQADFKALTAAKQAELAAGQKQLEQFSQDLAQFREKQIQAWQELEDTKAQLKIDQEFLRNLLKRCAESDKEFEERMKSRNEEILAVQDTIAFLNSDTAFDAFEKNVNAGASLVQASAHVTLARRDSQRLARAVEVLRRAGAPQLALLAQSAQQSAHLDAFTKVKAAIDTMVAELKRQQGEEVEHRDWCVGELNTNKLTTAAQEDKKASLETQMEDLRKSIEMLGAEIKAKQDSNAEMEAQMQKASEVRESERAAYDQTIAEQAVTQAILQKALDRMREVYSLVQGPGAPQMQLSGNHTDAGAMPARFNAYEKNAGGAKVVAMLEVVLGDAVKMENEAHVAELNAQGAYEMFMKDSNRAIAQNSKSIADMMEEKAKNEMSMGMAKSDLATTSAELEGLSSVLADLRMSCDFLLRNFAARQEARTTEMDALQEAKAILSGME